jgi:hypothetical protein
VTLVPFKRELHLGMQGKDVRALQRALRKADCRNHPATGDFRKATRRQVLRFKRRHHLPRNHGKVGKEMWAKLQPYFDGYDYYLCTHMHTSPPISDKTSRAVKTAWWYLGNKPHHYLQQRPMIGTAPPPSDDDYMDCSEFQYVNIKSAGLPDPSGYSYPNYGNTDSFLAHLKHASGPAYGVLVFYSNPGHVALCVGKQGGVWMVISHGSEGGPLLLPYNYRTPTAYRLLT